MANQEQLDILEQGGEAWNIWRKENPKITINLSNANLGEKFLRWFNFYDADLHGANLVGADLSATNLNGVNFSGANLVSANLHVATLIKTNLTETALVGANFNASTFSEVNFYKALMGDTIFARVDLREARGLEDVLHDFPSCIGIDTLQNSLGEIPEIFLRGCGLSDWEIESAKLYRPNLRNKEVDEILYKIHDIRAQQSIQISPLFISYSHADTLFVEKLEIYLNNKGIRFWRDVHSATVGRLEKQIDLALRQNPTVILILSENSTSSDWVEHEARLARELEKELGRDVLCPIALDSSWKSAKWRE